MEDFVREDGELFVDPGSCESSPEFGADENRDRAPAPAPGGSRVSACKTRQRLLGSGVRHGEVREYFDASCSGLEYRVVDLEEGSGPRKRKRATGLTDHPARGWGPEKHREKRKKEGRRVGTDDGGGSSSGGDGFRGGEEEHGEGRRETMAAASFEAQDDKERDLIDQLFESGRKKMSRHPRADAGLIIEEFMAQFEVAYEEDAILNNKPGNNKLRKLPLLIKVLSKKNLHKLFLDHGILTLLKNWLEPLPDGSMPSVHIRTGVLKTLSDFPIDVQEPKRREEFKKSGLGKVIMLLSRSVEETAENRKLAKDLIDKWSRQLKTGFEDIRRCGYEKALYRPHQMKYRGKAGQGGSRPEPLPLDLVMRPKSKVDRTLIK